MLLNISPEGWLLALVYFVTGALLALMGARRNSLLMAITLGLASCAVMVLNAAPSDLADGLYGIEVVTEFVLATLFSFAGLATVALLIRKRGRAK